MPKGNITIFYRNFVVSQNRKTSCFTKFLVSINFMDKRGREGASRFCVEFFCLSAEKFRWGTFCAVFQEICGSEKVYG